MFEDDPRTWDWNDHWNWFFNWAYVQNGGNVEASKSFASYLTNQLMAGGKAGQAAAPRYGPFPSELRPTSVDINRPSAGAYAATHVGPSDPLYAARVPPEDPGLRLWRNPGPLAQAINPFLATGPDTLPARPSLGGGYLSSLAGQALGPFSGGHFESGPALPDPFVRAVRSLYAAGPHPGFTQPY